MYCFQLLLSNSSCAATAWVATAVVAVAVKPEEVAAATQARDAADAAGIAAAATNATAAPAPAPAPAPEHSPAAAPTQSPAAAPADSPAAAPAPSPTAAADPAQSTDDAAAPAPSPAAAAAVSTTTTSTTTAAASSKITGRPVTPEEMARQPGATRFVALGKAVHLGPTRIKPMLKAPGTKRLKLHSDDQPTTLLSNSTCAATPGRGGNDAHARVPGRGRSVTIADCATDRGGGGLHSSTFQLNLSRF